MLSNREFSALVDKGTYPDQVAVPLDAPFVNQNGEIQNILLERFTSSALIRSVPGAIRANHYHKTDWHYTYVVSGCVWYYWRAIGAKEKPRFQKFPAGTMFFTPPMQEHAMFFPEKTDIVTFAKNIRDTEHHEQDVVRVTVIAASKVDGATGDDAWRVTFPGVS